MVESLAASRKILFETRSKRPRPHLDDKIPVSYTHLAESGLNASNISTVREHFNAALVGTSLLRDPRGIRGGLADFEEALFPR